MEFAEICAEEAIAIVRECREMLKLEKGQKLTDAVRAIVEREMDSAALGALQRFWKSAGEQASERNWKSLTDEFQDRVCSLLQLPHRAGLCAIADQIEELMPQPCPACGNEERHPRTGLLTCECPAPESNHIPG